MIRHYMTSAEENSGASAKPERPGHPAPHLGLLVVLIASLILCSVTAPVAAQVLEPETLQRKQDEQQRARTMTRELLGGVLDVQLRQLEENGLSDQEIFRDIQLMRRNLNHLVETEMSKVVDLLAEAQRLPADQREATFVEARRQIRTVVRQLAVERQNLLKRLKIAELAEQVRRLIRQQSVVQTATKGLPTESQARQEALTLKAIEDQRDVKELFLHLVDTMVDMKSWTGMLATTSADGLRILKAADVGRHLDLASRQLQDVRYEAADDEQSHVNRGLQELLKVIERAQGALNSENLASIDRVRILAERQRQLREETKSLGDNSSPSAEFVERQAMLQKEISKLTDGIHDNLKAENHVQQAETAAMDAAAALLDGKLDQARADQGRVLGQLAALERALHDQARQQSSDRSANELANMVSALEQAKLSLTEARKKQDSAETKAQQNAKSAAVDEKEVADIVQKTIDTFELPAAVETALAETSDAAKEATKNLEAAQLDKLTDVEEKSLLKTGKTLDRAIATIDATLADTARQMSAVKIGELARAAEVLERAAAEERAIAKDATSLALNQNAEPAETSKNAKKLADRQQDVRAIADKAAEALTQIAPAAAKQAAEGAIGVQQSANNLESVAAEHASDAKATITQAARFATEASQKLSDAAKAIREEIVSTASELVEGTSAQAEKLTAARAAVEKAVDQLMSRDDLALLEAARNKLGEASREQAKAQGKPEAAGAMELAERIRDAIETQGAATAAATALKMGFGSELKATAKQEEVVEKSQAAAELATKRSQAMSGKLQGRPDAIAQALSESEHAASKAAKQTLDGDVQAAEESRHVVQAALKRALELAQSESAIAQKAPPSGSPDKQAQAKATEAAKGAASIANQTSVPAGSDVASAAAATEVAEKSLSANSEDAPVAQAKAAELLSEAKRQLDAAIQKAAGQQALKLGQSAKDHAALADHVASVDPAAAVAIDSATAAAKMGSEAGDSPHQMTASKSSAEVSLEHAVADLGAKEQDVRRDRAIAESVAQLAKGQQSAAETIAEQAGQLEKMTAVPENDEVSMADRQSAAEKLNDAQQQFADSQRATGQGAVELSGQREVANQPLREALELASQLPLLEIPASMRAEKGLSDGEIASAEDQSTADAKRLSADGQPTDAGNSVPSEAARDGRPQGDLTSGKSTSEKPNALGTGFVPNSPQLTAEMMAGSKAQSAAQKALSQMQKSANQQSKDGRSQADQTSSAKDGQPIEGQNADSSKLTKKEGAATTNQQVKDGPVEKQREGTDAAGKTANKDREKDEAISARQLKEEAWFAKLPPELRKSIRAGSGQKPPRAYEERLKKYFQSVD